MVTAVKQASGHRPGREKSLCNLCMHAWLQLTILNISLVGSAAWHITVGTEMRVHVLASSVGIQNNSCILVV